MIKQILFITDTYYPDSGATTTIVKRICESLTKLGYEVSVYPAEISGMHLTYPENLNGVKILKKELGTAENICSESCRHSCPDSCRNIVREIDQILDGGEYECVFSAAVAFEVNFLAHAAIKDRKCKWFPMSYDPYAFNPHITDLERGARIRQEEEALKDAEKIFFLIEFTENYIGSPIENKIEYFNLPCIREINPDRSKKTVVFDDSYINCVFLGDFYTGIENTDFIFRLFEKLTEIKDSSAGSSIRLYTIGNPGDYQNTMALWKEKLGDRYICFPRISQEEAHNVILDSDVLVSMGHDSPNMCPSKAIDFVSSGKPILHISKIENCCAEKYLKPYPNKHCIYQGECLTEERIGEVSEFIFNSKGKDTMPFDTVRSLYNDFTLEKLIDKITGVIESK